MSRLAILRADERPHSTPVSPSTFLRAEACTKSVELTRSAARAGRPPRTVGFDALFGIVTHEVLAWCLRTGQPPAKVGAVVIAHEEIPVTDSMRDMVQLVLDEVSRRLAGRKLLIEARVNLPWSAIWGFVDVATAEPPLTVIDLKTGFHPVSSASEQLGLYLARPAAAAHALDRGRGRRDRCDRAAESGRAGHRTRLDLRAAARAARPPARSARPPSPPGLHLPNRRMVQVVRGRR